MIKKYRKKPVIVEAVRWTGKNTEEVINWIGKENVEIILEYPGILVLVIHTLGGDHQAKPGDYIIKGIKGEFYPCKPHIFNLTFEEVGKVTEPEDWRWKVLTEGEWK